MRFTVTMLLTAVVTLAGLAVFTSGSGLLQAQCCFTRTLNATHCGQTGPCLEDCNIKNACSAETPAVKYDCCVSWFQVHDAEYTCVGPGGSNCDRDCVIDGNQTVGTTWPFASCCNVGAGVAAIGASAVIVYDPDC